MPHPASSPITISVAMTTYNGCPYVDAQLESMAAQIRLPDEIVIGDDQSTDATAEVVAAFASRHPQIPVRFERNADRLGSTRNFEHVVRRCSGDVVAFADQDDLWMPNRLARVADAFAANPDASYLFSDGLLINGEGMPLAGTLFSSVDFTSAERTRYRNGDALSVLLRHNVIAGATLAVRRKDLIRTLPFEPGWFHDYFVVFLLETLGRGVLLDEPLIQYRRHRIQQVGVAGQGIAEALAYARKQNEAYCRRDAANFQAMRKRLIALGFAPTHPLLVAIDEKVQFFMARARMRAAPRFAPVLLWQALRRKDYVHYALGWKQVLVDVMATALTVMSPRQK